MALVKISDSREIPDENGGWYWMKWGSGKWEPVEVNAVGGDWPACIYRHSHSVEVTNPNITWGHQIFPPQE